MKNIFFFLSATILSGLALSLDSVSITVADAIIEPGMKFQKKLFICFLHAFMQMAMPLAGFFAVHALSFLFKAFLVATPFISFALLLFIGLKMILEKNESGNAGEPVSKSISLPILLVQGVAASIDALSMGIAFAKFSFMKMIFSALIIGSVTFTSCIIAFIIGKKIGEKFSKIATIIGGMVLILVGVEILVSSFF